jgi:hypothetical protein
MINMMYLVLTALLALNVSAEILNAFKTVNKSLETTNTTVANSTETIMKSLQDKLTDQKTHDKAMIWLPKANSVHGPLPRMPIHTYKVSKTISLNWAEEMSIATNSKPTTWISLRV